MRSFSICLLSMLIAAFVLPAIAQDIPPTNQPCQIYDDALQPLIVPDGVRVIGRNETGTYQWNATDEISMVQIGTAVAPMYNTMTGGDSDQDGLFEVYMYIKDNAGGWTYTYRIYENDGANTYNQTFQAADGLIPYAYGDLDDDGLPEVIGQWSSWLYVYESPGVGRQATQLVWQSPALYNITGYTAAGDLDQDGFGEIIHTQNSFGSDNRLVIYECTGDNQYQEIFNTQISNYNLGTKAIADFDGDGFMELAMTSGGGEVLVFESTGNNDLNLIYRGDMNTANAYACSYADDMDGNGHPEFVCGGSSAGQGWKTQIYEADGNNSFVVRQEIIIDDGYFGSPGNDVGDLDGDGVDEIVIQTAQALHLYKWNGNTWALEATIPENFGSINHGVFVYESNNNGHEDIFWLGLGDSGYWTNETIILEDEESGGYPAVEVELTYINLVPPCLYFDLYLVNNDPDPVDFDGWFAAEYEGGAPTTLVARSFTGFQPGWTIDRPGMFFPLVGTWAPGNYMFWGRVGSEPGVVWDESGFPFIITGSENLAGSKYDLFIDFPGPFDVIEKGEMQNPSTCDLISASPNPFNPATTISYQLTVDGRVHLAVYDIAGRQVTQLVDGWRNAGTHDVTFDATGLASGVYLYRLTTADFTGQGKMVLMK